MLYGMAVSTTAFGAGSVAGSGIAWRIRPQRPLLVYIALYFLEIPLRLAWALLAPLPVLAVSAGNGRSFLRRRILALADRSGDPDRPRQLGTVAAADEAIGALANPLAIALTPPDRCHRSQNDHGWRLATARRIHHRTNRPP